MIKRINNELKTCYNSDDLVKITGISERTLRYRISQMHETLGDSNSTMFKIDGNWHCHYTVAYHFLPKYKSRNVTLYNLPWKNFITWVPKNDYDLEYHNQLIDMVQTHFSDSPLLSSIEKTERGINHVHMVSTLDLNILNSVITGILNEYIQPKNYRLEIEPIRDKISTINYVLKETYDIKSIIKNQSLIIKNLKLKQNEKI